MYFLFYSVSFEIDLHYPHLMFSKNKTARPFFERPGGFYLFY